MNNQTLILIGTIIASPFLGAFINNLFSKSKVQAETHKINITGEISIGEAWEKYAVRMRVDMEELQVKIAKLSKEFDIMRIEKDKEIELLQGRVKKLEGILKANNISYEI